MMASHGAAQHSTAGRGCCLWDALREERTALCHWRGGSGLPRAEPRRSPQGYHDFCLQFALVSTMLLQKEPSMEALLMKALRANLSELRNQLLKELQDFIQQYDATHPSC